MRIFSLLAIIFSMTVIFLSCNWSPTVAVQPEPLTVIINEFMASNGSGAILDEFNEADDWIELYNTGKTNVSLKGLYLSDDSAKLDKFALPDTVLSAHSFLLIWADNQNSQGKLHASFKISGTRGETLFLTFGQKNVIDTIRFLPSYLCADRSYGRWTDGALTWSLQVQSSPGKSNLGGGGTCAEEEDD